MSYRQQLRRDLARWKRRQAHERLTAALKLRQLTRPAEPPQQVIREDEQGNLKALTATAPTAEDTPTDVPEVAPPAERTPADQTFDPPANGVPFTAPIVVLEGWETSDGRYITPGSLGRRDLPQTLMAMTRNPDGGWGHDAAIIAGRIDTLERYDASAELNRETGQPFGSGVFAWRATGYLTPHPDQPGSEATVQFVRDHTLRGISVDLGEFEAEIEVLEEDEEGFPEKVRLVITQASIGQFTLAPFAAFPGAYLELDEETPAEETPPAQTAAAPRSDPAMLRLAGEDGCAPCDAATYTGRTVVASAGIAPELPPATWFNRVEQANPARHVYLGRHPDGTPTGQVWGYIAEWGVCHSAIGDRCVVAPRLGERGYDTFMSQGVTMTADGREVGTGILTFGGGHANLALGVTAALAHYDNAGTAYADVRVGEDDFGIWFAGAMRSDLTREQIEQFGRHPLSGDWRANQGDTSVRFVAALSVNTPGYSIGARAHVASSGQRAIVAAGAQPLAVRQQRAERGGTNPADVQAAIDRALRPILASAGRSALDRLTRRR